VFLKAVLEYPGYGEKLVKDIEKWGNWITEKLRQDELIKKLYDDYAVYTEVGRLNARIVEGGLH